MSIHGAEYSFNPAWMAPYAANHYAYGYVCGLEDRGKDGRACWSDHLKNAPLPSAPHFLCSRPARSRDCHRAPECAVRPAPDSPSERCGSKHASRSGTDWMRSLARSGTEKTQAPVIATLGSLGARVLTVDGALLTVPERSRGDGWWTPSARAMRNAGAVLLGLSRGLSLPDAVAFGNRVSAAVVQTAGATLSEGDFAKLSIHKQGTDKRNEREFPHLPLHREIPSV